MTFRRLLMYGDATFENGESESRWTSSAKAARDLGKLRHGHGSNDIASEKRNKRVSNYYLKVLTC
jgi:hypothetical protein